MSEKRPVIVERDIPYPAEKIWRALTQPHLIGEWLMKGDIQPAVGTTFSFKEEWGSIDCKVLAVEPNRSRSYSWSAFGHDSVVTFTLTPTATGTQLRVEQDGFVLPEQMQSFAGARAAWPEYLKKLEEMLGKVE